MTDQETAAHIKEWLKTPKDSFSWPTDACGYDQHIKFVEHRNKHWVGGNRASFLSFVSKYADDLAGGAA